MEEGEEGEVDEEVADLFRAICPFEGSFEIDEENIEEDT
jgi:hypothetical protein